MEYPYAGFPTIYGPTAPEEYERPIDLGPGDTAVEVSDQEIVVEDPEGEAIRWYTAASAHAADGAAVPTTQRLEGDEVILTVHHREGNPAAGGAPFVYPIYDGEGWEGGFRTFSVELNEPHPPAAEPSPEPVDCDVPSLHGLKLRAAKAKLRADHCGVGVVHLAPGTTAAKDRIVKQFRTAGTELAEGTPVAVKLGSR